MIFSKRFNKFLKSEQCKMIGCIFLVLLASIMIKLSMPDTFEHLNPIKFVLKFKEAEKTEFKISQFTFSVNGNAGELSKLDDEISEITFDIVKPSDIKLSIVPKNDIKDQIKSITINGATSADPYDFTIAETDSSKTITMTVNTDE